MNQTAFHPYGKFNIEYIKNDKKMNMKIQHYHDNYEIYLQISGERYLFLDDICYTLKSGDLVILKPFEIHYTESRDVDYYERYVMNLSPDNLSFFLTKNEIQKLLESIDSCVIHLNEEQAVTVLDYFKKADTYSKKSGILMEKLLYTVVFQMLMMIQELTEITRVITNQNIPPEIVTAIHYMNKNYQENIDLNLLSELVHMSKYHFCRLFHQATGATFLEYLYNIRLTKVHRMLIETEFTINEIAEKTGFSSTAHMSRVFRQVYHVSPRGFRKSAKVIK